MEKVDRPHWERAELFEFFSAVSHPFYSVTFRVDVTNLYRYVKERHLSFYYAMGYLVTDAVNSVKISATPSGTARYGCWMSAFPV